MKQFLLALTALFTFTFNSQAADLEATATETASGGSTGTIDLEINGGVAPFAVNWTGPGGFSSSDEDLSGLEEGIYTVTVTDNYCGVATLNVVVTAANSSSITEEDKGLTLSLYPNPTSGLLFLKANEPVDVVVYNIVGERIFAASNVTTIDLSNQPAGIYMIHVSGENEVVTRKVTVQ